MINFLKVIAFIFTFIFNFSLKAMEENESVSRHTISTTNARQTVQGSSSVPIVPHDEELETPDEEELERLSPVGEDIRLQKAVNSKILFPFRIGFEFQLSPCIFHEYSNKIELQKRPLIGIKKGGREFWHIVIDGDDIEFVTHHFSHHKEGDLKLCLFFVHEAINSLIKYVNKRREEQKISFGQWVQKLTLDIKNQELEYKLEKNIELKLELIKSTIIDEIFLTPPSFKNLGEVSKPWEPTAMPQVTIQHPLEHTVFLSFGLFGFKNDWRFLRSLPNHNKILKELMQNPESAQEEVKKLLQNKLSGLAFLHALTIEGMARGGNEDNFKPDTELLQETLDDFNKFNQIDAKSLLRIMSRRPFSLMFNDIIGSLNTINYSAQFKDSIEDGNIYFKDSNIVNKFNLTNYGEQYFEGGTVISLKDFKKRLRADFAKENSEILDKLLQKGIISTVMLRNLVDHDQIFVTYYQQAIDTVQNPKSRYVFDPVTMSLELISSGYDVLSPPLFLKDDNSMGRFKKDTPFKIEYGEAIVEIRNISVVGQWFIEQMELTDNPDFVPERFLKNIGTIQGDGMQLFYFLKKFNEENFLGELIKKLCNRIKD